MAKQKQEVVDWKQPQIINRILTFDKPYFYIGAEKCKIISVDTNPYKISVRRSNGVKTYSQDDLIKLLKP